MAKGLDPMAWAFESRALEPDALESNPSPVLEHYLRKLNSVLWEARALDRMLVCVPKPWPDGLDH